MGGLAIVRVAGGIRLNLLPAQRRSAVGRAARRQLGVEADKLKPLLYALAAAGLLQAENGLFSNSGEANRFLVRGLSTYRGEKYERLLSNWQAGLRTAESIRTGAPQASSTSPAHPRRNWKHSTGAIMPKRSAEVAS
jgi:hypothetical protein